MWQKLQKTNVLLFHSKCYYFHLFTVKNYKCPDLSFCYFIFLSLFCKLLQANMMIGCRVMTKMQRPLIVMKFPLSILSLFRIRKREKWRKLHTLRCFLFTYSSLNWEYLSTLGWQSFFLSKMGYILNWRIFLEKCLVRRHALSIINWKCNDISVAMLRTYYCVDMKTW